MNDVLTNSTASRASQVTTTGRDDQPGDDKNVVQIDNLFGGT